MFRKIPNEWMADHLFVLVGGNPLPNYVAGKLLLKAGDAIHLIHSPGTASVANRLAKCFEHSYSHEIQNPSNGGEIGDVIQAALAQIPGNADVGLHYTGGTKAMAVHAHSAFKRGMAKRGSKGVLTYLDAATLSLLRDDEWNPVSVQFAITPELETLLQLHGIQLQHPPKREVWFPELNQALAQAHRSVEGQKAYDSWCQNLRREKDGQLARRQRDLSTPTIPYPTDPALGEVAEVMRKTFEKGGCVFDPMAVIGNWTVGPKNMKELIRYLDGVWVEHLVLQTFIEISTSCGLHDYGMSLDTTNDQYDFEFDVAAMQGYQLCAVSCTRNATRRLNKSKLFEATIRATQLGGDEARVGLVCCEKDPEILENQVTKLWGAERGKIRVFGSSDLTNLSERFSQWLSC